MFSVSADKGVNSFVNVDFLVGWLVVSGLTAL